MISFKGTVRRAKLGVRDGSGLWCSHRQVCDSGELGIFAKPQFIFLRSGWLRGLNKTGEQARTLGRACPGLSGKGRVGISSGDKAGPALPWLVPGGTPSLEWSTVLSGMGKFNDFKSEFNYMLSLTRRGYDGPITHVIYQQDICIHNKPTAKQSISVNAENVPSGHDVGPSHAPGGWEGITKGLPSRARAGCPYPLGPRGVRPRNALPTQQANPQPWRCVSGAASQRRRVGSWRETHHF